MSRNLLFATCAFVVVLLLVVGGYLFHQQQKEIQVLKLAALTGAGYQPLVAEWAPIIPQINCNWKDASQDAYGSGTLLKRSNGTYYILTNVHVVQTAKGSVAQNCDVIFPDAASTTYTVLRKNIIPDPSGADAALLQLSVDPYLTTLVSTKGRKICSISPALGDTILTFGYPAIGSSDGITVTEGIISGDEQTDYLSSAIINDGSSGGAAVDTKNDCYFGMTSFTYDGNSGSLAGILKLKSLFTDDPITASRVTL